MPAAECVGAICHPELDDHTALVMVGTVKPMVAFLRCVDIADQLLTDATAEHDLRDRNITVVLTSVGFLPRRHGACYVSQSMK